MLTARMWIYAHLACVTICVAFSLADRGQFISHDVSHRAIDGISILLFPALLGWLLCPMMTIAMADRSKLGPRPFRVAVIAEGIMVVAQVVALLPACQ